MKNLKQKAGLMVLVVMLLLGNSTFNLVSASSYESDAMDIGYQVSTRSTSFYQHLSVEFHLFMTSAERQTLIIDDLHLTSEERELLISTPVTLDEQIQEILDNAYLTVEEKEFFIRRLFAILEAEFGSESVQTAQIIHEYLLNSIGDVNASHGMQSVMDMMPETLRSVTEISSHESHSIVLDSSPQSLQTFTVNVPHRRQERTNWCGPATAQQTIAFFNGSAPTQQSLATSMNMTGSAGTDLPIVRNAVNRNISRWVYNSPIRHSNRASIMNNIQGSILNNIPPMIRVQHVAGWPYSTAGHFVSVSGLTIQGAVWMSLPPDSDVASNVMPLNNEVTQVQITDPWAGAPGSNWTNPPANGRLWVSSDLLFRAMTACTFRPNMSF